MLSDEEKVEILTDVARNGKNQVARVEAIKQLRELEVRNPAADGASPFAELDEVGVRRAKKRPGTKR